MGRTIAPSVVALLLLPGCGAGGGDAASSQDEIAEPDAVVADDERDDAGGLVALCDTTRSLLDEAAGGLSGVTAQLTFSDPVRFSESAMTRALDDSSDLLIEVHEAIAGTRWSDKEDRIRASVAEVDRLQIGRSLDEQGAVLEWVKGAVDPLREMDADCEALVRDDAADRRAEFLDDVD